MEDTLSIPELEIAQTAIRRFTHLLAPQQRAANELFQAHELAESFDLEAEQDLSDAMHLMQLWVSAVSESRKVG